MRSTAERLILALLVCAVTSAPSMATAHEEGVLKIASEAVPAGTSVALDGEHFTAGSYRLVLKGALREYELGSIEIGADGQFSLPLAVPAGVEPGAYRLVAVAADDDESGAVELEILAAAPVAAGGGEAGVTPPQPSAEELELERDWSGAEWFVVGVLLGGALVGGVTLLRRPRSA